MSPKIRMSSKVINVLRRLSNVLDLNMTETVSTDDPQATSDKMNNAVMEEVKDLSKLGVFKFIRKEVVPAKSNMLPCKFFLIIKVKIMRMSGIRLN